MDASRASASGKCDQVPVAIMSVESRWFPVSGSGSVEHLDFGLCPGGL